MKLPKSADKLSSVANMFKLSACTEKQSWCSGSAIPYMLYLTRWDKISQNVAHLEANSHKIFQISQNFRPSYNTFYEEINIHHTLLCLSQASDIKIKGFDYFGEASKWCL